MSATRNYGSVSNLMPFPKLQQYIQLLMLSIVRKTVKYWTHRDINCDFYHSVKIIKKSKYKISYTSYLITIFEIQFPIIAFALCVKSKSNGFKTNVNWSMQ